jgi:hypothetical protein
MKRFMLWMTLPGTVLVSALEEWLGGGGVALAILILVACLIVWIRYDNTDGTS